MQHNRMSTNSLRKELLALQWAQLRHDEAYHKDIVILPLAHRIRHMALHNTKYTAYFLTALDNTEPSFLERTLTDAFAIGLATANALNQDLGHDLEPESSSTGSLVELGQKLASALPHDSGDPLWLVRAFAVHNGRLAKACESLDHIEALPFRDIMKSANLELLKAVITETSVLGLDVGSLYRRRMREVEARSIFDRYYRAGAGGEA